MAERTIEGTWREVSRKASSLPEEQPVRLTIITADKKASPSRIVVPHEERLSANAKLRSTIISLGHTTGSDNESIDADLAREYESTHETS
jgi:hypothetical protein